MVLAHQHNVSYTVPESTVCAAISSSAVKKILVKFILEFPNLCLKDKHILHHMSWRTSINFALIDGFSLCPDGWTKGWDFSFVV